MEKSWDFKVSSSHEQTKDNNPILNCEFSDVEIADYISWSDFLKQISMFLDNLNKYNKSIILTLFSKIQWNIQLKDKELKYLTTFLNDAETKSLFKWFIDYLHFWYWDVVPQSYKLLAATLTKFSNVSWIQSVQEIMKRELNNVLSIAEENLPSIPKFWEHDESMLNRYYQFACVVMDNPDWWNGKKNQIVFTNTRIIFKDYWIKLDLFDSFKEMSDEQFVDFIKSWPNKKLLKYSDILKIRSFIISAWENNIHKLKRFLDINDEFYWYVDPKDEINPIKKHNFDTPIYSKVLPNIPANLRLYEDI